ncbi:MAG: preprotein translocase subunit YajC [Propionicimonas sp.]|uniref:preprotein translocase subunit YajC n=1 Tax=Propionicimonas sp. TaxID=1955623 RepID=UPI002B206F06|nr:preprotein translocase subunit YajC [Propionicimonas sp.]MEA4943096.1 preprotein translocase subunit YajC [Propionicimonas sp.]MEA5055210.1 preprotein translocase subunit YajC [Propionicimonas sp.]MEA5119216.1 preprotein translocase subunit YajC [Propionicimonas sp.]
METILMVVLMGAAVYFLMIRPQQKRSKEQKEKMASLAPGARVMTVSGIVGTIKHLGEKQAILELSPGVEMTVVKQAISTQAVEDEFEYADEGDEPAADSDELAALEPAALEPDGVIDSSGELTFDPTRPADPEPIASVLDATPADGLDTGLDTSLADDESPKSQN